MRTLWLLRHAKSSWDDPTMPDHDRPLAPRGRRGAVAMAAWFAGAEPRPELILCSTAVRARETLAPVRAEFETVEVRYEDDLYAFDAEPVLRAIRGTPDAVGSLLVVGHNPAMQDAALTLASRGERIDRVTEKFPTGAAARIDLDVEHWSDVVPGEGTLAVFVTPRDLEGQTR